MSHRWPLVLLPLLLLARPLPALAVHASAPLPALTASNGMLALSVQLGTGLAQGEAREVVYAADELGGEFKLSELFWDIDDVVMAGGSLSLQIGPRYRVQASYWAAVTEGSGRMDDYDWLLGPDTPWSDWSLSDVEVQDSYAFDLNVAAEVFRQDALGVSAVLGYRQDQWSWEDQALRFIYSENGFRDSVGEIGGEPSITYEQQFRIPYVGVAATLTGAKAALEIYFHYSPLVEAEDHDVHLLRNTTFDTEASDGDYFGTGLRAGYRFTPRFTANAAAEWQVIPEMRGDTEITDEAGSETNPDSAGIANQWMLLSFSLGYAF